MNKIITMLLILVGVILIFAFNSLHLDNNQLLTLPDEICYIGTRSVDDYEKEYIKMSKFHE